MWNMSNRENGLQCFALKPVVLDLPVLLMKWQGGPSDRPSRICDKHKATFGA